MYIQPLHSFFRFFCFSFAFLFVAYNIAAQEKKQNSYKDSLLQMLKTAIPDTSKVLLMGKLADAISYASPDSTLQYAQKMLELAKKINFDRGKGRAYLLMSYAYFDKGEFDESLQQLSFAHSLNEKINDKLLEAETTEMMGLIYGEQRKYETSLQYHLKSLEIVNTLNPNIVPTINKMKADCYSNIGNVYQQLRNHDKALEYYKMCQPLERIEDKGMTNIAIAGIFIAKNDNKKALLYAMEGLDSLRKYNSELGVIDACNTISEIFRREKNYSLALKYIGEATQIARKSNRKATLRDYYSRTARIYKDMGNFEKAYQYQQFFMQMKDSVLNEETAAKIEYLTSEHEHEKNEKELKILTEYNALQAEEIQIKNSLFLATALIVLLLLAFMGGAFYYAREKKRQNAVLRKQKNELRNLNTVKDRLFSIIAHDIKIPLHALNGLLTLFQYPLSQEEMKEVVSEVKLSTKSLSDTLENLFQWASSQMQGILAQPEVTDIKDIVDNNIDLLHEAARQKNIQLLNNITEPTNIYADTNQVKLIVRNLLSNAIKFTPNDGKIIIDLLATSTTDADFITLHVWDNGIGISPENIEKLFNKDSNYTTAGTNNELGTGLGLILCKEFAEANGGYIRCESEIGKGTAFFVQLPKREK
jgi:signal transduction histidine kinase